MDGISNIRTLLHIAREALAYHINEAEQRHEKERLIRPDRDIVARIDAALAEPIAPASLNHPAFCSIYDDGRCTCGFTLRQAVPERTPLAPGEGTWSVFAEKVVRERDEARAEVARLRWGNEMACENTPTRGCECPGCGLARERAERGEA